MLTQYCNYIIKPIRVYIANFFKKIYDVCTIKI